MATAPRTGKSSSLDRPRALVIRDGRQQRIPGRAVVPGDIIVVAEGDRVPADALLRAGINLSVDESPLTGESVPVRKAPPPPKASPGRPESPTPRTSSPDRN